MAKYSQLFLVVALLAAAAAEPPRRFNPRFQNRNRFFARQEVAPSTSPAPAPYPPAGIKPDIPFELPSQEKPAFTEPDQTYGPPDQTYGPPDQTYGPPDQTYGPPSPPQPEVASPGQEDFAEQTTDEPQAERLIFVRRNPGQSSRLVVQQQRRRPQAAALTSRRPIAFGKSAALRQPAKFQSQPLIAQPVLLQDGSLVYSIRL